MTSSVLEKAARERFEDSASGSTTFTAAPTASR